MIRYGVGWWRTRIYWWLYCLTRYLMTPCLPMKVVSWFDWSVLRRRLLMKFYDTWTLRVHIISGGKWRDLCYGKRSL